MTQDPAVRRPGTVPDVEGDLDIASLGYFLVASDALDEWKKFAGACLGMQVVDQSTRTASFRMDDRAQRLIISKEQLPTRYTIGWQASSPRALQRIASRLEQHGTAVERATRAIAAQRMVRELIIFDDPAGNRVEVFDGPESSDVPFLPGRAHSGFRTGALGFGHIVLTAPSLDALIPFYRDLLGFRISDYQLSPFRAYFFHVNRRHHSLALIQLPQAGIHHLMIEHLTLDDVGQGHDVAVCNGHSIGVTLGRHTNDLMTSFYVQTPSPFLIEVGWGGRDIDVQSWQPVELKHGPSLWGHDRSWLNAEQFAEARRLRLRAAADGSRAPVNVLPGRYIVCSED